MKRIYRIKDGFSLMEMMVVMLVVSIILALSAPMITKKTAGVGPGHCLWTSLTGGNIGFNVNQDDVSVVIGGNNSEIATMAGGNIPKLTLSTKKRNTTNIYHDDTHIGFVYDGEYAGHMTLTNNHSIMLGANANVSRYGSNSIAIGSNSYIECSHTTSPAPATAIAIGANTNCSGGNHIAVGTNAIANGWNSIAIGESANVNGYNSLAIWYRASSNPIMGGASFWGHNGTAIGAYSSSRGENSTAIGWGASARDLDTVALGRGSIANNYYSLAIGSAAKTRGYGAIAIGCNTNSEGIVIGYGSQSNGSGTSIGVGANTGTLGIAIGCSTNAPGWGIAIGSNSKAEEGYNISIGERAYSGGNEATMSIAIGYGANATSTWCTAIGDYAKATGEGAVSIGGYSPNAAGAESIAIGRSASLKNSGIAIGNLAVSRESNAIAIGTDVTAAAANTIVIGHGITNSTPNVLQLGDANTTVYIPGKIEFGNITANNITVKNDLYAGGTVALNNLYYCANRSRNYFKFAVPASVHYEEDNPVMSGSIIHGTIYGNIVTANSPNFNIVIDGKKKHLSSDKRLKNILGENYDAMDKIRLLKVYDYTFKKEDLRTPHVGVMAQDLQKIFPNAVTKDENGYLQIRHEDMFYAMINALKELDAKIKQIAFQLAENIKIVTSDSEKIRDLTIRVNSQDKEIKAQRGEIKEQNQKLLAQEKTIKTQNNRLKMQEQEINVLRKEVADLKKIVKKLSP